ncbi:hypothetical protein D3C76_1239840 [compost metagenome]
MYSLDPDIALISTGDKNNEITKAMAPQAIEIIFTYLTACLILFTLFAPLFCETKVEILIDNIPIGNVRKLLSLRAAT